jgi:RNA polymerase sigma-70 factor (ECF subfamily)
VIDTSESDEALATLASRGDRAAFEMIMRRHKAAIFAFVRRYVGQADDANDVLQETFLAAWLAIQRYDPERAFLPWLRTIALNKCRDHGRRQKVRRLLLLARATEPQEPPITQAEDFAETVRLNKLDEVIAELPAFYKEPLLLTTVSGLSQADAAVLLKTTAKAVEMRVRRARLRIARAFDEDTPEG